MYFGNNEYIEEQAVLQEFNVSKNDLKDPNYLNKVKEKLKKAENAIVLIDMIFSFGLVILSGIVTGSILVGIAAFLPIMIFGFAMSFKLIMILPSYDKRREQIKEKVLKIKAKAEKMKDCKEKQEIIKNCDRLLQEIDKEISKEENEKRKKYIKLITNLYNDIYNLYTKGIYHGEGNDLIFYFDIAQKYMKISPQELEKNFWKNINKNYIPDEKIQDLFGYTENDRDKKVYNTLVKYIKEYKDNDKVYAFYAIDDTAFLYLPKTNVLYYGGYYADEKSIQKDFYKSLYSIAKLTESYARYYSNHNSIDIKELYEDKDKLLATLKLADKYHLIKVQ